MFKQLITLCTLLTLALSALAIPSHHGDLSTNAKRLAAGLPPLPPRRFARAGELPTPVEVVKRTRPSSQPEPPCKDGKIKVKKGNNWIGYVEKDLSRSKLYGVSDSYYNRLVVKPKDTNTPFALSITNGNHDNDYFGAVTSNPNNFDLKSGSNNYMPFSATAFTPANAKPQQVSNDANAKRAESTIWSFASNNGNTKQLLAQWINNDGTKATNVKIFYDPEDDFLALVGDSGKFTQDHKKAYEVTLWFEE